MHIIYKKEKTIKQVLDEKINEAILNELTITKIVLSKEDYRQLRNILMDIYGLDDFELRLKDSCYRNIKIEVQ